MSIDNFTEDKIGKLRSMTDRLKSAKEALEIDGACPEAELTHEYDPYNIGFIWSSICNSLHNATDSLNAILSYVEPGGLKEALDETQMVSDMNFHREICEADGTERQHNGILDDDGK